MASPRKNKAAAPAVTLDQVKKATAEGGFVYTSAAEHADWLAQGLVEINTDMTDADGKIATRATNKEETQVTEQATQTAEVKTKPVFQITDEIPEAVKKPRVGGNNAGREEIYPFSQLEVGKGFFVPGKEAKAMASTVASANARYSEVIEGQTRTQTRGKNKGAVVPATRQLRTFKCWDGVGTGAEGTQVSGVWVKREA